MRTGCLSLAEVRDFPNDCDALKRVEDRLYLSALLDRLTARERKILYLHYGLYDGPALDFRAIGAVLGVSQARIRQIHNRALGRVSQRARSLEIGDRDRALQSAGIDMVNFVPSKTPKAPVGQTLPGKAGSIVPRPQGQGSKGVPTSIARHPVRPKAPAPIRRPPAPEDFIEARFRMFWESLSPFEQRAVVGVSWIVNISGLAFVMLILYALIRHAHD